MLVSRLNGLPQLASKTRRVKRVKCDGEERRRKKSCKSREKRKGEEVIVGVGLSDGEVDGAMTGVRGMLILQ